MMLSIWKFPFEIKDEVTISIPEGPEMLHVDVQDGKPCLWALVDTDANCPKTMLKLRVIGTGEAFPYEFWNSHVYLGTLLIGGFVWHVYEDLR